MHPGATTHRQPAPGLWVLLALLGILVLAAWARLDDLGSYRHDPASQFADGEPLLLNPDGYYFLSLARDLLEDTYAPVDPLRGAPEGAPRPSPPPPLVLLTAAVSAATGLPLGWAAALLPALLGPLLALPVFAVGRRLGGSACGVAAALIAVLSHYYVYRTTVGFHDTDALNVTLAMALTGCGLALADARPERFTAWLAGGLAVLAFYVWWWQGAWSVVVMMGIWILVSAVALRRRHPGEARVALAAAAAVIVLTTLLFGVDTPLRLVAHGLAILRHVGKAAAGDFPNVAASIGEQAPASLAEAARMTMGDPILLGVAVAGALVLLVRKPRAAVMLLPLVGLAVAGILHAQRFLIFAAPVTGLGIGYLAARGLEAARGRRTVAAVVGVGVLAVAAPSLHRSFSIDFTPSLDAELVSTMQWLSNNAPEDAVVWGYWDHGYALRYWSRRATINDGSQHDGETTVYNALPFAAPDYAQAANFMQFYSVHGRAGMQRLYRHTGSAAAGLALARRVFTAGPRQARAILAQGGTGIEGDAALAAWMDFLFPSGAPAVYLLLDQRMLRSVRWWFEYGTWAGAPPESPPPRLQAFAGLGHVGGRIVGPRVEVDPDRGVARLDDGVVVPLSRIVTATTRGIRERRFPRPGPEFHLNALDGVAALQDPALAATVFNRTFILRAAATEQFHPELVLGTRAQVWRVRGASR